MLITFFNRYNAKSIFSTQSIYSIFHRYLSYRGALEIPSESRVWPVCTARTALMWDVRTHVRSETDPEFENRYVELVIGILPTARVPRSSLGEINIRREPSVSQAWRIYSIQISWIHWDERYASRPRDALDSSRNIISRVLANYDNSRDLADDIQNLGRPGGMRRPSGCCDFYSRLVEILDQDLFLNHFIWWCTKNLPKKN